MIDDGSTDGTRQIVEAMARAFPEIRLLLNPRKGIAAARNTGLDTVRANCRYVTFLDADDLSYPGRIERQRALLVDDPTIDVLYGRMRMFNTLDGSMLAPAAAAPQRLFAVLTFSRRCIAPR